MKYQINYIYQIIYQIRIIWGRSWPHNQYHFKTKPYTKYISNILKNNNSLRFDEWNSIFLLTIGETTRTRKVEKQTNKQKKIVTTYIRLRLRIQSKCIRAERKVNNHDKGHLGSKSQTKKATSTRQTSSPKVTTSRPLPNNFLVAMDTLGLFIPSTLSTASSNPQWPQPAAVPSTSKHEGWKWFQIMCCASVKDVMPDLRNNELKIIIFWMQNLYMAFKENLKKIFKKKR